MSENKSKSSNHEKNKGSNHRKGMRFVISLIGGSVFTVLLLLYLVGALYYKSHFFSNTMINGINTTNMTVSEAQRAINAEVAAYQLTLVERNNVTETILGSNIDLHTEFNGCVDELLAGQNSMAWPVYIFSTKKYDVETMLAYDENLLKVSFDRLKCFDKANSKEPVNASVSAYHDGGYQIVAEDPGAKVIKDKLYQAVVNSINALETTLSVEDADCYEKPDITSDYPLLVKAVEQMNKIAGAKINYHFGDATEVVDGSKISKWLSLDDNYKVAFDENGVKEFVDYIGKTYNTFGKVRTFKTTYGKEIKVQGGDYGWWLNRPEEVKELTQLIKDGAKQDKEPVYFQTAQQYGPDDIGNTYVEINLSAQHLFFYKNGTLVLETDFVSGNVSKGLGTPVGTYPVQYKESNATLVGEDYSTPVKYWMPFNKNIGLHDAPWRSKFGKAIYLTNGSHGCINMPPAMAKKMFKDMARGVAVVVYELPGTENYDTDKIKMPDTTPKADEKPAADNTSTKKPADKKSDDQKPADQKPTEEKPVNEDATQQ